MSKKAFFHCVSMFLGGPLHQNFGIKVQNHGLGLK